MVQLSSSLIVVLALAASSFSSPTFKRSVPQVEADLATITTKVGTLYGAIHSFTGVMKDALDIHNDARDLAQSVGQAAHDVSANGDFSESDSAAIVATVHSLEPKIIATLQEIVAKKGTFDGMPVGGITAIIKADINTLNSETTSLESALAGTVTADKVSQVQAIKAAIDAAFHQATVAYA